jgi:hypothetical protein
VSHDAHGKELFQGLLGKRWCSWLDPGRCFDMNGVRADLDGIIRSEDQGSIECAVEIEARTYKQIRGAIVDLAWHPAPKKLLVVMRAQPQLGTEETVVAHCTYVWERLSAGKCGQFRLVVLKGAGNTPQFQIDSRLIGEGLLALGISSLSPKPPYV